MRFSEGFVNRETWLNQGDMTQPVWKHISGGLSGDYHICTHNSGGVSGDYCIFSLYLHSR